MKDGMRRATAAIEKAYREGGLPAAQTVAGGYGLPLSIEHSGEEPVPTLREPASSDSSRTPSRDWLLAGMLDT